jgi:hypothetical protein
MTTIIEEAARRRTILAALLRHPLLVAGYNDADANPPRVSDDTADWLIRRGLATTEHVPGGCWLHPTDRVAPLILHDTSDEGQGPPTQGQNPSSEATPPAPVSPAVEPAGAGEDGPPVTSSPAPSNGGRS